MSAGYVTEVGVAGGKTVGFGLDRGLEDHLAQLREEFEAHGDVEFRAVVEGTARALRPEADRVVRGVCREALSNVFRHANASCVELELVYRRRDLRVVVRDNGVGMSNAAVQLGSEQGLLRMKERAEQAGGRLRVLSQAGVGTEIEMTVPGAVAFAQGAGAGWMSKIYFAREKEYV